MAASSLPRNRVPIHAPAAPRLSAAASPRPSAMPPAAATGVGFTASTTAGMSGSVATSLHTCPPASQPCATSTSTPQSTARRASSARATVCRTLAPPACVRSTSGAGSPQKKEITGTPSSRQTASRSSCGQWRTRLAPNGRSVSARVLRTWSRTASSVLQLSASMPRPPALLTAAASAGQLAPPIAAWMIGTSRPSRSHSGVYIAPSLEMDEWSPNLRPRPARRRGDARLRASPGRWRRPSVVPTFAVAERRQREALPCFGP